MGKQFGISASFRIMITYMNDINLEILLNSSIQSMGIPKGLLPVWWNQRVEQISTFPDCMTCSAEKIQSYHVMTLMGFIMMTSKQSLEQIRKQHEEQ